MSSSRKQCPIPFYQQPCNEYKILRKSCFFSWPTSSLTSFLSKLSVLWFVSIILNIPIIADVFLRSLKLEKAVILDVILSSLVVVMFLIRLYLGWTYVMQRLLSATVFYEESGWYDGQIWIKPSEVLMQDRLIGIYEVMPLLKTIKKLLSIIVLLMLVEIAIYCYI